MSTHPAALQSGSAIYLPPSTQLREDNVNRLHHQPDGSYYSSAPSSNPFIDDAATITPFDSISNIDDRDDSPPPAVYGGQDYLARDPYARNQQGPSYSKSYNTRPRSGSAGEGYDPRDSNGSLPLMQNAVTPAGTSRSAGPTRSGTPTYYPDSIIDGDTVINSNKAGRKSNLQHYSNYPAGDGAQTSTVYPPPPRYDGPDDEEKGDFTNSSIRNSARKSSSDDDLVPSLKEGKNQVWQETERLRETIQRYDPDRRKDQKS